MLLSNQGSLWRWVQWSLGRGRRARGQAQHCNAGSLRWLWAQCVTVGRCLSLHVCERGQGETAALGVGDGVRDGLRCSRGTGSAWHTVGAVVFPPPRAFR